MVDIIPNYLKIGHASMHGVRIELKFGSMLCWPPSIKILNLWLNHNSWNLSKANCDCHSISWTNVENMSWHILNSLDLHKVNQTCKNWFNVPWPKVVVNLTQSFLVKNTGKKLRTEPYISTIFKTTKRARHFS